MKPILGYTSLVLNALFLAFLVASWLQRVKIVHGILHAIETAATNSFSDAYPVEARDVVFLGDSITAGGQWAEIFPGIAVKNRGVSGDRTADVLKRLRHITTGRPRKVFLMVGTNDIGLGIPQEQTLRNYSAILDQLMTESPETRIYVQSVLPREAAHRDHVITLNDAISAMAQERGLVFVDLFSAFVCEDGSIRQEFSYDSLHLTGQGYRHWHSLLEPFVKDQTPQDARG